MIISFEFDIHNQSVRIGDTQFPFMPADSLYPGAVRVGHDENATVLRPLTFGERYEVSMRAAMTADPVEALCQGMFSASKVEGTECLDQHVLETMAMIMSGGNEETPPYTESLRILGAHAGWSIDHIEKATGTFVDRILVDLAPKQDDGWTRVVFEDRGIDASISIPAARQKLAENLLGRLDPGFIGEPKDQSSGLSLPGSPAAMYPVESSNEEGLNLHGPAATSSSSSTHLTEPIPGTKNRIFSNGQAQDTFSSVSQNVQPNQGMGPIVRHRNHIPLVSEGPVSLTPSGNAENGPRVSMPTHRSQQKRYSDLGRHDSGEPRALLKATTSNGSNNPNEPARYSESTRTSMPTHSVEAPISILSAGPQVQQTLTDSLEHVFQHAFFHTSIHLPEPGVISRPQGAGPSIHDRPKEDPFRIAQQLARLLDQEADLRGIDR